MLRVQSALDVEFAANALGIAKQLVANAPAFRKGQGLISGRWIANDIAIDTRFGPARTVVAGGGLPGTWRARTAPSTPFVVQTDRRLHDLIVSELKTSPQAVALVELAETVRTDLPGTDNASWQGYGSFKALLASLAIEGLRFSAVPPGYAYLDGVHQAPTEATLAKTIQIPQALRPALEELHRQTGTPLLSTTTYKAVFETLSEEVQERPFALAEMTRTIRDRLLMAGIQVGRGAIDFIVKGIHFGGHRYDPDLPQDAKALAAAFIRNLRNTLQVRPPLEGEDLTEALSFCGGSLLSPAEAAQIATGAPLVQQSSPAAVIGDVVAAAPSERLGGAGIGAGTAAEHADSSDAAGPRS